MTESVGEKLHLTFVEEDDDLVLANTYTIFEKHCHPQSEIEKRKN